MRGLPAGLRPLTAAFAAMANDRGVFPFLSVLPSGLERGRPLPTSPAAGGPSRPHLIGKHFRKPAWVEGGCWSHAQTLAWDGVPREPAGPGACTPLGMHVASPGGYQPTISLKVN